MKSPKRRKRGRNWTQVRGRVYSMRVQQEELNHPMPQKILSLRLLLKNCQQKS